MIFLRRVVFRFLLLPFCLSASTFSIFFLPVNFLFFIPLSSFFFHIFSLFLFHHFSIFIIQYFNHSILLFSLYIKIDMHTTFKQHSCCISFNIHLFTTIFVMTDPAGVIHWVICSIAFCTLRRGPSLLEGRSWWWRLWR